MKRFLSILLALALALTLGIPALAAEHQAGDTYIRILGSSGARTVGVRTTYGAYRQTADGAVYRDDRYEFVYTDDGGAAADYRVPVAGRRHQYCHGRDL